jgi:hypothetical protein
VERSKWQSSRSAIRSFDDLVFVHPNTFIVFRFEDRSRGPLLLGVPDIVKNDPWLWVFFTIAGVAITTVGTLIASFVKDYVQVIWLDQHRDSKALERIYKKYRDPILLSAKELAHRLQEIVKGNPPNWLESDLWEGKQRRNTLNDSMDPHFQQYKQISTAYRLAAFLGWLEIYRQEVVFLNPGRSKDSKLLQDQVERIRMVFAEGRLNAAPDFDQWLDGVIFREELRAIGECMIIQDQKERQVIGYGKFCSLFDAEESPQREWAEQILQLFLRPRPSKDFRLKRIRLLLLSLIELIRLMDSTQISADLQESADGLRLQIRDDNFSQGDAVAGY